MKTHTHPVRAAVKATTLALGLLLTAAAPLAQGSDNFPGTGFAYPGITQVPSFNNSTATAEPGELSHRRVPSGTAFHSYWFTFTVQKTGYIALDTVGSNFDTVLAVYTGTKVNALTKVAGDDDMSSNATSQVTFLAKAGTLYRVAVDGFSSGSVGNANLQATSFIPLQAKTWTDVLVLAEHEGSGILTLTTATTGAVSGTLKQGARSHPFTSAMSSAGRIVAYILRTSSPGQPPAILDVTQDSGGLVMNGTLYADAEDTNDQSGPAIIALRSANVFTAANPCPRKGLYTFSTPFISGIGCNFGTMTVSTLGAITVAGFRGDGAAYTLGGPELNTGSLTTGLFRARVLVGTGGHVTTSLTLNNGVIPATIAGTYACRRGIKPGAPFLPDGAHFIASATGGLYVPPLPNTRMNATFNATAGKGRLIAACSSGSLDHFVFLSTANTFTYALPNTPKVMLTANKANGLITGSVLIGGKTCVVKGVSVPGSIGFRGFTQGLSFNGVMTIEATP